MTLRIAGVLAIALAFGCGGKKKDGGGSGGGGSGGAKVDCAAFGAKLAKCPEEFWTAYAGTDMAKRNAPDAIKSLRSLNSGGREAQFCSTMQDMFGSPSWPGPVNACMAKDACGDWAACIAPVITAAAK